VKLWPLTEDESAVLLRLLARLTNENSWLNAQWIEGASAHEITIIHQIVSDIRNREVKS